MAEMAAHPADCPNWDYEDFSNHAQVVLEQSADVLLRLRTGGLDTQAVSSDTRPIHFHVFKRLVPDGCEYFAGHYRGEFFRCLKHYQVTVGNDPQVGYDSGTVIGWMDELGNLVDSTLQALDQGHSLPNSQVSPADKLLYTVAAACRIFELLLRIHPYANGNGHMARFVIWAILGRFGHWPHRWTLEPRPPDPPYTDLIIQHRNGNPEPLERFVLNCIAVSDNQ